MDRPAWMDSFLEALRERKKLWDNPEYQAQIDEVFKEAGEIMNVPTSVKDVIQNNEEYKPKVEGEPPTTDYTWLKLLLIIGIGGFILWYLFFRK